MSGSSSKKRSHETAEGSEEESRAEQDSSETGGDAVEGHTGPRELYRVPDTQGYYLFQRALHFLYVSG